MKKARKIKQEYKCNKCGHHKTLIKHELQTASEFKQACAKSLPCMFHGCKGVCLPYEEDSNDNEEPNRKW